MQVAVIMDEVYRRGSAGTLRHRDTLDAAMSSMRMTRRDRRRMPLVGHPKDAVRMRDQRLDRQDRVSAA
jgi:hypothetical protein